MVKNMRDVPDPIGRHILGHAQRQVVLLAAIIPGPEPAELLHQRRAVKRELRNVIRRAKKIWIPIRLEMRIRSLTLAIDRVFVRVDQIITPKQVQLSRDCVERMLSQPIARLQKSEEAFAERADY